MQKVIGYKAFNIDMTDNYGNKYAEGQVYSTKGEIKFGTNGFHMCKNIEDVFRYYDSFFKKINICEVRGTGELSENFSFEDDYYGYYDMYAVSKLEILKILSYDNIIECFKKMPEFRLPRFIMGFDFQGEEMMYLINKYVVDNNYNVEIIRAIKSNLCIKYKTLNCKYVTDDNSYSKKKLIK
ncbi:MAG: hypothetical protein RR703_00420 [Bacilli bacterium]